MIICWDSQLQTTVRPQYATSVIFGRRSPHCVSGTDEVRDAGQYQLLANCTGAPATANRHRMSGTATEATRDGATLTVGTLTPATLTPATLTHGVCADVSCATLSRYGDKPGRNEGRQTEKPTNRRVAQRQSAAITWQRLGVQFLPRLPYRGYPAGAVPREAPRGHRC